MALFACPRCNRDIADGAQRCKACGWRYGQPDVLDAETEQADALVARTAAPPGPSVVVQPVMVKSGMSCWAVGSIVVLTVLALPVCAFLALGGLAFMRGFLTGS